MPPQNDDPIAKFAGWLDDARRLQIPNYEAMALATVSSTGRPAVRFVLLKAVDERGCVFFTDRRSRKGRELRHAPLASLAIYWDPNRRQVRAEGHVEEVEPREVDNYWSMRARQTQLAAAASFQSARLRSQTDLLGQLNRLAEKFKDRDIPRPRAWTGYRLFPDRIEFWTHREDRLHERELYIRRGRKWRRLLLQP